MRNAIITQLHRTARPDSREGVAIDAQPAHPDAASRVHVLCAFPGGRQASPPTQQHQQHQQQPQADGNALLAARPQRRGAGMPRCIRATARSLHSASVLSPTRALIGEHGDAAAARAPDQQASSGLTDPQNPGQLSKRPPSAPRAAQLAPAAPPQAWTRPTAAPQRDARHRAMSPRARARSRVGVGGDCGRRRVVLKRLVSLLFSAVVPSSRSLLKRDAGLVARSQGLFN
eukprot:366328-Chlamydomonas_euryale.AAC.7